MKFKGILLDIDNTLYDYKKRHEYALESVFNSLGTEHALPKETLTKLYAQARSQIHKELSGTAAAHNRMLYFQRMFELLNFNALKYALSAYNKYWNVFLDSLVVREGVCDFLDFVKDAKICLVSDLTAHIQYRKIQRLRLAGYADFLVTSEEAGREKPHPRIFKMALTKLKIPASRVCMIGDCFEKDILGAIKLKIKSFWLNTKNETKKAHPLVTPFKNFFELIEYLK